MTGRLRKQAIGRGVLVSNRGSWKDRTFRLEGGCLRYYRDESLRPEALKGEVFLNGCSVARGSGGGKGDAKKVDLKRVCITLPEGPVSATSSPGLVSHRKLEHTPAPRQRRGSCWSRAAQHRAAVLAHRTRARCAA